jgi:U4/U6 small nuclear ribonucleoprotein PRP31
MMPLERARVQYEQRVRLGKQDFLGYWQQLTPGSLALVPLATATCTQQASLAMASFADELLADLGSDGSGDEVEYRNGANGNGKAGDDDGWGAMQDDGDPDDLEDEGGEGGAEEMDVDGVNGTGMKELPKNAVRPAEEMVKEDVDAMKLGPDSIASVKTICKLMDSSKMKEALESIERFSNLPEPDLAGILEESPEYQLIVRSNNLAVDVDNEEMIVHKFIRDHYAPRFPELESLILNPWEFVQAVQAIGNDEDLTKAKLDSILPHGTVVVISMTASTTKGRKLSDEAWSRIEEACKLVYDLEQARRKILEYVESRMSIIAPNLSKVVGSRVATKLLGLAGGLTSFTKIPACNVMLLGASRKVPTGLSTAFSGRHLGFINQAPLIADTPEEYHRQANRIVSAKALLAARVDAGGSDRHGIYGAKLLQELSKKLEKLQEPPPARMVKALPIPKEGGNKKRRGGRRARKLKEMNGMTELRKMQNRVRFGEEEEETGAFDETVGMGMISSKGDGGRIRSQAGQATGAKAKMSKRNQDRINTLKASRSGASVLDSAGGESSGTASSLSFTPVQGIELVDPSRQRKVDEANAKWFKEGSFSVMPGAKSSNSMGPPSIPASKKQRVSE